MVETNKDDVDFQANKWMQIKHDVTQQIGHVKRRVSHMGEQVAEHVTNLAFSAWKVCSFNLQRK